MKKIRNIFRKIFKTFSKRRFFFDFFGKFSEVIEFLRLRVSQGGALSSQCKVLTNEVLATAILARDFQEREKQ